MIIEQRLTDMVEVTDLPDGISHLSFAFETTTRAATAFYVPTQQVREVLSSAPAQPVTALADHRTVRQYLPLNPECTESIFTDVPVDLFYHSNWRALGGMPKPFADADAAVPVTPDSLFCWDRFTGRVYGLDGQPVSIAFAAGDHLASAYYYDLPALAALLADHPWIKGVAFDAGYPGPEDHVAASLTVIVSLPQDVYAAALAAIDAAGQYLDLSDVLFAAPRRAVEVPGLGPDPLGIAAALRSEPYQAPQEDWDYGPTFPALAESLPSVSELLA